MLDEQTLLRNARQSVKDEQAARRKQHLVKVHALWDDCYDLLSDYARECIPDQYESDGVSNHETALENVRQKLRRCKSNTRAGFIVWGCKQLAKEKGFHLVADAVSRFDLDISDWIADAALRLARYADFPEHYRDGDLYRVKMGTRSDGAPVVWTVPKQHWEFVKKLWPVSLKQRVNGAYFIAKQISGQTISERLQPTRACGNSATVGVKSRNGGVWEKWNWWKHRTKNLRGLLGRFLKT